MKVERPFYQIHYEAEGCRCVSGWVPSEVYELWLRTWKNYTRTLYVVRAWRK